MKNSERPEKKGPRKRAASFKVTKLDAARRQIETAISLWFQDGDPVAIHTLTAAGHRIFHDIVKKHGGGSPFFFNMDLIMPAKRDEYRKFVCLAENFFKHAEREPDPLAAITFRPGVTEFYLLDAIELFHKLNRSSTPLMMAFRFRFQLFHPDGFSESFLPLANAPLSVELRGILKREFLNVYLEVFRKLGR